MQSGRSVTVTVLAVGWWVSSGCGAPATETPAASPSDVPADGAARSQQLREQQAAVALAARKTQVAACKTGDCSALLARCTGVEPRRAARRPRAAECDEDLRALEKDATLPALPAFVVLAERQATAFKRLRDLTRDPDAGLQAAEALCSFPATTWADDADSLNGDREEYLDGKITGCHTAADLLTKTSAEGGAERAIAHWTRGCTLARDLDGDQSLPCSLESFALDLLRADPTAAVPWLEQQCEGAKSASDEDAVAACYKSADAVLKRASNTEEMKRALSLFSKGVSADPESTAYGALGFVAELRKRSPALFYAFAKAANAHRSATAAHHAHLLGKALFEGIGTARDRVEATRVLREVCVLDQARGSHAACQDLVFISKDPSEAKRYAEAASNRLRAEVDERTRRRIAADAARERARTARAAKYDAVRTAAREREKAQDEREDARQAALREAERREAAEQRKRDRVAAEAQRRQSEKDWEEGRQQRRAVAGAITRSMQDALEGASAPSSSPTRAGTSSPTRRRNQLRRRRLQRAADQAARSAAYAARAMKSRAARHATGQTCRP